MYCTKCGNLLHDDDCFCAHCGTPVRRGDEKSGEPAKPEMLVQSHPQTGSVKIPVIPVAPERKPEPEIPAAAPAKPEAPEMVWDTAKPEAPEMVWDTAKPEPPKSSEPLVIEWDAAPAKQEEKPQQHKTEEFFASPKKDSFSEADRTEKTEAPKKPVHYDEFVWGVHDFTQDQPRKTEDLVIDWSKPDGGEADALARKAAREAEIAAEMAANASKPVVPEKIEIDEKPLPQEKLEEEIFAESEPENEDRKKQTERLEKFYTFNKKNEEFQKLLDQEYEKIKAGRSAEGSPFGEDTAQTTEFGKPAAEAGVQDAQPAGAASEAAETAAAEITPAETAVQAAASQAAETAAQTAETAKEAVSAGKEQTIDDFLSELPNADTYKMPWTAGALGAAAGTIGAAGAAEAAAAEPAAATAVNEAAGAAENAADTAEEVKAAAENAAEEAKDVAAKADEETAEAVQTAEETAAEEAEETAEAAAGAVQTASETAAETAAQAEAAASDMEKTIAVEKRKEIAQAGAPEKTLVLDKADNPFGGIKKPAEKIKAPAGRIIPEADKSTVYPDFDPVSHIAESERARNAELGIGSEQAAQPDAKGAAVAGAAIAAAAAAAAAVNAGGQDAAKAAEAGEASAERGAQGSLAAQAIAEAAEAGRKADEKQLSRTQALDELYSKRYAEFEKANREFREEEQARADRKKEQKEKHKAGRVILVIIIILIILIAAAFAIEHFLPGTTAAYYVGRAFDIVAEKIPFLADLMPQAAE